MSDDRAVGAEEAFVEICNELGCDYDNEAALLAISNLKLSAPPKPAPDAVREAAQLALDTFNTSDNVEHLTSVMNKLADALAPVPSPDGAGEPVAIGEQQILDESRRRYKDDKFQRVFAEGAGWGLKHRATTPVRADREAIARIIDPVAFDPISLAAGQHPGWEYRRIKALETADAILSLDVQPGAGEREWQTIASAPKDGQEIEVKYLTDDPRKVRWSHSNHGSGWHLVDSIGASILRFDPTHWRPRQPQSSSEGEQRARPDGGRP